MRGWKPAPHVLLLLPAFIVLAAVVVVPLLLSLYSSFTPFRLTRPDTIYTFIGFRNYVRLLTDMDFWVAFGRTVLLLTFALNLEMLLGLGLALLVEKATRGQRILRTIMMFPMMFSPVLVGFQFKFMFNDNIGVVNNALQSLGLTDIAIPWLIDGQLAFISILIAEIWSSTAVFAIFILAGLMAMPREPLEAAKVDGCTSWQSFRYVTWPFIMPFAYIAMTIRSLDIARAYDIATRGQRILRTIMMFPMMFSPVLVGFQFKFMFNDNIGVVNNALQSLGLTDIAIPWLIDGQLAFISILIAEIWSSTAVFAIFILAGLMAMPREPLEAAKVDGCTSWQSFRYVTWPFIMPFAYIAMTIRSLDIARAYDIVKIMTDGGPAGRTEILWTMIARTAYSDARMGLANAMAYIAILLSILFTALFFRQLAKARQQIGAEW
eukprot:g19986.t1